MKEVLMMLLPDCPYCRQAEHMLSRLMEEEPRYRQVDIRRVDESAQPEFAATLDYYYVPTFFVGGQKRMEGVPTLDKVRQVLDAALEEEEG